MQSSDSNFPTSGLTYRDSGVDIEKAGQAKERIKALARSTFNQNVISEIGSFAGIYRPDFTRFREPVLVSSADGVGTKLKIAFRTGIHSTVGTDIVAHCCNDILVRGALPLFFLDYIATGKLEPGVVEQIVEGLATGCREAECALLGGETAEMPDFYSPGEYDLAGFIVGISDAAKLYDPEQVQEGDQLIGLPSSGLHTNGYSLVRKLFFEKEGLDPDAVIPELSRPLGEELLVPHRNYLPALKELLLTDDLHSMAHITGGGITDNLRRALPAHLDARVQEDSWEILPIFRVIQDRGKVKKGEMFRTFNMGLGMILVVAKNRIGRVEEHLKRKDFAYFRVGEVVEGSGNVVYI